ncbi:hypothetical protein BGZ52_012398, partial [Haplosporangium bisporale]
KRKRGSLCDSSSHSMEAKADTKRNQTLPLRGYARCSHTSSRTLRQLLEPRQMVLCRIYPSHRCRHLSRATMSSPAVKKMTKNTRISA